MNLSSLKPKTLESSLTPFSLSSANLITYPFKIYPVNMSLCTMMGQAITTPCRDDHRSNFWISLLAFSFVSQHSPSVQTTTIFLPLKSNHSSLLLRVLQWLPISFREKTETLHSCLLFAPAPTILFPVPKHLALNLLQLSRLGTVPATLAAQKQTPASGHQLFLLSGIFSQVFTVLTSLDTSY